MIQNFGVKFESFLRFQKLIKQTDANSSMQDIAFIVCRDMQEYWSELEKVITEKSEICPVIVFVKKKIKMDKVK